MGNSNPQIFRELKERLTLRNIGIAVIGALIVQVFISIYFNGQIPTPTYVNYPTPNKLVEVHSKYCDLLVNNNGYENQLCKLNGAGDFMINWKKWWADVFVCSSWIIPLGLILGSVYMLVADLVQEEKRGTLNFIRLSPQSARKIFIGKILGVPSLVYLTTALMLPFHLFAGFNGGASIGLLAGWYVSIGSVWFLFSSAAVLYVLLGGIQAILTVIAVAYPVCLPLWGINAFAAATINQDEWLTINARESISWFGIPVFGSAIGMYAFVTACCLIASYWAWEALERRYLNPTATAISKTQSYQVNLCWQIFIAGLVIPLMPRLNYYKFGMINGFAVMDFIALALLIPMLLPSKQALQDWSRYRRERATDKQPKFWQRELGQDLLFNDKSPTLLAIAINIGMAMVLWVPVSLITFGNLSHGVRFIAGGCLATSLILIYAALAHLGLFLKVKKRNLWIAAILGGVMVLPLLGAFVLSPNHAPTGLAAMLLLFSPFAPMGILKLAGGSILVTFAAQLAIFGILTRQLQRKLQISGQSQSKELLAQG
ncbi:hypothetical protein [Chamaesiphon sp. VAR_48_metabat_135_sub]|uniref:hypothetical protein n=1 Tax=Chamaesiphon sp. VAR_48_metabat_135_sub TaxID=2964699 RepID=UPI00286CDA6E|nr:hypothetical protein [Chamaesiphon sp. VAR_48_metabat_135_sub]